MPEVKTAITKGRYSLSDLSYETDDESSKEARTRNFFLYGVFRTSPLIVQPTIYSRGTYNAPLKKDHRSSQELISMTKADGMNSSFLKSYAVLCNLANITSINDSTKNTFLMMSNDLPHDPMLLQEPAFEPSEHVDNSSVGESYMKKTDGNGNTLLMKDDYQLTHYQTNVAAMLKLGEWLDYMKEEGVYDNTRIIIVSDHGRGLEDNIMPQLVFTDENGSMRSFDSGFYDSVLMVKDFDSKEYTSNDNLISNADTPYIAVNGLIKDPVNPYTGNRISRFIDQKEQPELIYTADWDTDENNGNTFLPADWLTVHDNIYNKENWGYLGVK